MYVWILLTLFVGWVLLFGVLIVCLINCCLFVILDWFLLGLVSEFCFCCGLNYWLVDFIAVVRCLLLFCLTCCCFVWILIQFGFGFILCSLHCWCCGTDAFWVVCLFWVFDSVWCWLWWVCLLIWFYSWFAGVWLLMSCFAWLCTCGIVLFPFVLRRWDTWFDVLFARFLLWVFGFFAFSLFACWFVGFCFSWVGAFALFVDLILWVLRMFVLPFADLFSWKLAWAVLCYVCCAGFWVVGASGFPALPGFLLLSGIATFDFWLVLAATLICFVHFNDCVLYFELCFGVLLYYGVLMFWCLFTFELLGD